MGDITPGYLFVPSEGRDRLSSTKLNAAGNGAKINPSFISSKPPVSSVTSGDQLIMLKADGTYARVPATAVGSGGGGGGGDMFKSVYDANADNIVDHAALADTAPWAGITGKPASFPPATHGVTHLDNGTDVVPVVTTVRTGLVPVLPNDASKFLNGSGAWSVAAGGSGNTFDYRWSTVTTAADPGSGYARANNANPLSATAIYISIYDRAGSLAVSLSRLSVGDQFYLYETGNATQYVVYQLSSIGIFHSTWYELPVTVPTPNGFSPAANASIEVALPSKPSAHATTHLVGGSDPIALATTVLAGLCPAVDNTTIQIVSSKLSTVALAWTAITGKPATFPPDSTGMLKSVYDTNADNIVDQAAAVPWTGITGKPSTFAPTAHGPTHLDNGSDVVPVVTTTRTGLVPILSGSAATYLDGTGVFSAVSGSVNPGTWTNLSLGSGWTAPTQAQYRLEVNGAVSTVYFRGMIQAAYSAMGTTAFTAPVGARPSMTRSCVLGGAQNTGTAGDVASYLASISSAGVCTIYFLCAAAFVWADSSRTQQVYLDSLFYSL
jgi:hypothetical protein